MTELEKLDSEVAEILESVDNHDLEQQANILLRRSEMDVRASIHIAASFAVSRALWVERSREGG